MVDELETIDREPWERLARGYQTFYNRSLPHQIFGLGARVEGRLVGIWRENNAGARRLYDSLAAFDGFIRYERSL